MPSSISEFDEAYDDFAREPRALTADVLEQPIRLLEPIAATTLPASASVAEAVVVMNGRKIGGVLVMDSGRLAGIFTDRDVVRRVLPTGLSLGDARVGDYMTREPAVLSPDDPIAFALNRTSAGGFRHVPLVDDAGQPVAVVSVRDVVRFLVEHFAGDVQNLPPTPSRRSSEFPPHGAA